MNQTAPARPTIRAATIECELQSAFDDADFSRVARISEREPAFIDHPLVKESLAAERLFAMASSEMAPKRLLFSEGFTVVTIVHTNLPHLPGGYSARSHGLQVAFRDMNLNALPYSRPGYWETLPSKSRIGSPLDVVDGIVYRHLPTKTRREDGEYQYMVSSVTEYRRLFSRIRPNIVHARSTYLIALPAIIAARSLGIPTTYEVSGLWELVHEGRGLAAETARTVRMETATMKAATNIVTLTSRMRDIINSRTGHSKSVTLAPNAVRVSDFDRVGRSESVSSTSRPLVVGYIGSLLDYEGVDLILRAVAVLRGRGAAVTAKIVGGGSELGRLRTLAEELAIEKYVEFSGAVDATAARSAYADVDICAFPRLSTPATEAVSPLKPFEAMAARRPFVVSDVAALREIAQQSGGLVVPAGDHFALASALEKLIWDQELRAKIADDGYRLVSENHTWERVASALVRAFYNAESIASRKVQGRHS